MRLLPYRARHRAPSSLPRWLTLMLALAMAIALVLAIAGHLSAHHAPAPHCAAVVRSIAGPYCQPVIGSYLDPDV